MICFSRDDIERISLRVINKYKRLPDLQGLSITKIDPTMLAVDLLDLSLDFVHISLKEDILGLTCLEETGVEVYDEEDQPYMYMLDGSTILVEADLKNDCTKAGRCNFSIMHETAHQIFGKLFPKEYGPSKQKKIHCYNPTNSQRSVRNWEEWQANTLASALLMPKDILIADMKMFDLGERIRILNSIYEPETFFKFRLLAEYLGVSQQALAIRMKHLDLLDRDYLNHARDMITIFSED